MLLLDAECQHPVPENVKAFLLYCWIRVHFDAVADPILSADGSREHVGEVIAVKNGKTVVIDGLVVNLVNGHLKPPTRQ